MAASRRPPPMEVYTDPDVDHNPTIERDIEKELYNALGPLGDATNKANVQLNPSFTTTTTTKAGSSPSKKHSSPLRPISSNALAEFNIPPPTQPNFNTDSPRKNGKFYSMYQQVAPPPKSSLFAEYALPYDKENVFESASFGDIAAPPFQEPDFGIKGPNKRVYNDAPNTKQSSKKQKSEVNEPVELPDPQNMPTVVDDGQKPQLSYAELIGMAILRSPSRRLTLAQIYKWISDNFVFYRNSEGGWQNSIRHNLSLNKNFIKQERPKDDPGKGNYWAIKPGEERPFLLGKKQPIRKAMNPDGSQYFGGLPMSDPVGFRAASAPAIGNFSMGPTPSRKMESQDIDSARFPDEIELSSEGTILASDPALQEDEKNSDAAAMPPPPVLMRSSPPPQDLGSSPPTMEAHRRGTPPPAPRYPSSSRSGGRKRKFAALNDSGYWSSIESSAARGAAQQLASESDIRGHRIKKGRAEAEIARIRSSSFDSPSKEHARNYCRLSTGFDSSPAHRDDNPLTPVVVFKRPAKPPPSISPNTNLQDHRNAVRALLGSPAKSYSPMPANSWSPAFELHEEGLVGLTPNISPFRQDKSLWRPFDGTSNALNGADDPFNFHIYPPEEDISARGSPEKRSTRRLSLARAATSTGILADITGSAKSNNSMLAPTSYSPFSLTHSNTKAGFSKSPARLGSPLKRSHVPPTSSAPASNIDWLDIGLGEENKQTGNENSHDVANLFGVDFHSDGSEEGIDIFQDFGKIGQTSQGMPAADRANGSPIKKVNMGPPARPSMARSNTSRW